MYEVTPAGRERLAAWLVDASWPKIAPVDFHLKLVAAAMTGLADPIALIDTQRRELLRRLHDLHGLASGTAADEGQLLLDGARLRLEADIRWLDACEQFWTAKGKR